MTNQQLNIISLYPQDLVRGTRSLLLPRRDADNQLSPVALWALYNSSVALVVVSARVYGDFERAGRTSNVASHLSRSLVRRATHTHPASQGKREASGADTDWIQGGRPSRLVTQDSTEKGAAPTWSVHPPMPPHPR